MERAVALRKFPQRNRYQEIADRLSQTAYTYEAPVDEAQVEKRDA